MATKKLLPVKTQLTRGTDFTALETQGRCVVLAETLTELLWKQTHSPRRRAACPYVVRAVGTDVGRAALLHALRMARPPQHLSLQQFDDFEWKFLWKHLLNANLADLSTGWEVLSWEPRAGSAVVGALSGTWQWEHSPWTWAFRRKCARLALFLLLA